MFAVVAKVAVAAGSVSVTAPNAPVAGESVIEPLVAFENTTEPTLAPATPRSRTLTPFVASPAATFGAAPAPPPSTSPLAVSAPEDASEVAEEK